MKNIKFRVWCKKLKELKYFTIKDIGLARYLEYVDVHYVWSKDSINTIPLNDKNPISLCTGLKDINGKEIYEGDIVKNDYNNPDCKVGKVIFDKQFASFGFKFRKLKRTVMMSGYETEGRYEVIGNIFENKKLLK